MKHIQLFQRHFRQTLPDGALERLAAHAELLERWNRSVRLVGERDPADWVERHYAESVAARGFWKGSGDPAAGQPQLLDIGSGAGFPGLVLAALHPERSVSLVEARERKAAFLAEAARELGLPCVRVLRRRFDAGFAETLSGTVECVTVRALRLPETTMLRVVEGLPQTGRLVLWAGRQVPPGLSGICAVEHELTLPGSTHRRVLCLRPLRRG